ncbi:MAG: peptide-methionine (R)-S-oxide reductase [Candidatus Competibacteraceae bacterium]
MFDAETKFDSGTGWPSTGAGGGGEGGHRRGSPGLFMRRTEVLCADCQGASGPCIRRWPRLSQRIAHPTRR